MFDHVSLHNVSNFLSFVAASSLVFGSGDCEDAALLAGNSCQRTSDISLI